MAPSPEWPPATPMSTTAMRSSSPPARLRRALPAAALSTALLAAAGLAACQNDAKPAAAAKTAAPVSVGVVTLATQSVGLSSELPGRVTAPQVAEVRPQVRGLIRARLFTEGAAVRAGQVLYEIEPDSYRIALASAQASLERAQATLDAAKLTAQRRVDLFKIEAVAQQDVQDAQVALQQAQADLAAAKAARDAAQLNLERTRVTAPISGRVDVSSVTPGALVTADQTTVLTTVRQTDPIQVDISQSSAELLRLKRDFASGSAQQVEAGEARIRLLLEDGSAYALPGQLKFSGVSVNTGTGAVTLRAVFPNPKGELLPGMYVRAVLETAKVTEGLVLPQTALQRDARGAASVLLVGADNKVERRAVKVSRAFGTGWLVSEGVKAGERVIVEGLQKVKAGDAVQAHPVAADASAAAPAASTAASR